ncbi:hypothetical protein D9758_011666 [Tetrapyrgos nigripes]|uniref:Uncharacterized protein n=1 Tax=Tetrapyrgos nigripes TaxID=182062 RepID=A0A8H5CSK4_9AGAR|nr:hypothetical protein D9758_011666 [Tetrapyrgos nigripes]
MAGSTLFGKDGRENQCTDWGWGYGPGILGRDFEEDVDPDRWIAATVLRVPATGAPYDADRVGLASSTKEPNCESMSTDGGTVTHRSVPDCHPGIVSRPSCQNDQQFVTGHFVTPPHLTSLPDFLSSPIQEPRSFREPLGQMKGGASNVALGLPHTNPALWPQSRFNPQRIGTGPGFFNTTSGVYHTQHYPVSVAQPSHFPEYINHSSQWPQSQYHPQRIARSTPSTCPPQVDPNNMHNPFIHPYPNPFLPQQDAYAQFTLNATSGTHHPQHYPFLGAQPSSFPAYAPTTFLPYTWGMGGVLANMLGGPIQDAFFPSQWNPLAPATSTPYTWEVGGIPSFMRARVPYGPFINQGSFIPSYPNPSLPPMHASSFSQPSTLNPWSMPVAEQVHVPGSSQSQSIFSTSDPSMLPPNTCESDSYIHKELPLRGLPSSPPSVSPTWAKTQYTPPAAQPPSLAKVQCGVTGELSYSPNTPIIRGEGTSEALTNGVVPYYNSPISTPPPPLPHSHASSLLPSCNQELRDPIPNGVVPPYNQKLSLSPFFVPPLLDDEEYPSPNELSYSSNTPIIRGEGTSEALTNGVVPYYNSPISAPPPPLPHSHASSPLPSWNQELRDPVPNGVVPPYNQKRSLSPFFVPPLLYDEEFPSPNSAGEGYMSQWLIPSGVHLMTPNAPIFIPPLPSELPESSPWLNTHPELLEDLDMLFGDTTSAAQGDTNDASRTQGGSAHNGASANGKFSPGGDDKPRISSEGVTLDDACTEVVFTLLPGGAYEEAPGDTGDILSVAQASPEHQIEMLNSAHNFEVQGSTFNGIAGSQYNEYNNGDWKGYAVVGAASFAGVAVGSFGTVTLLSQKESEPPPEFQPYNMRYTYNTTNIVYQSCSPGDTLTENTALVLTVLLRVMQLANIMSKFSRG